MVMRIAGLLMILVGCVRAPVRGAHDAMRPAKDVALESFEDQNAGSLLAALEGNVRQLKANGERAMVFGPVTIRAQDYASALESLIDSIKRDPTGKTLAETLAREFSVFEVYGIERWGEVFLTSYFEPVIPGSLTPSGRWRQPLYGVPKNFVEVDMDSFQIPNRLEQSRAQPRILKGLARASQGRPPRIYAMPDRAAIDSGVLGADAPVLAYVDPIDAFILEIQGSGVVKLANGRELKIGFAEQNGHPYVAIGKFLKDQIPAEKMSLQAIERHIRGLPESAARNLMNQNPSHVFFRPVENAGLTFFGPEVSPGRTIATDPTYFPKGALALLEFEAPVFSSGEAPSDWIKTRRLVVDQDVGGAIRGPGRVDLFWGRGEEAKRAAGVMRRTGRLYYFIPKTTLAATIAK